MSNLTVPSKILYTFEIKQRSTKTDLTNNLLVIPDKIDTTSIQLNQNLTTNCHISWSYFFLSNCYRSNYKMHKSILQAVNPV